MTTGLTSEGFIPETFQSLRESVFGRLRAEFGNSLPLDDSVIEGQSWLILIECLTKLWELGEVVVSSQDRDKATGAALDSLCLLTGTFRRPPSFGTGKVILTGDASTSVPADTGVRIGAGGAVAITTEDSTLVATDAWITSASYVVGDIVTNAGNVYYCRVPADDTIAAPTHVVRYPTGTIFILDDPAIFWVWVGTGAAHVETDAIATETGPVNYASFAIDQVVVPVSGLDGVGNALDFELGRDLQSDESLRESSEANLSAPGTSTRDAIRAALLDLDDVVSVTIFVNNTNVTDADGLPPHSIEALVRGGMDQSIRDCLLANVAAGIYTYGNTSGTAFDSEGTSQSISFSRPDLINIYVALTLTYDAKKYPADGDDATKQSVVDFGDEQDTGKDAVAQSIGAQANKVDGVVEVTAVAIGTAPGPTLDVTITISLRQLAVFDTSRVSVASSPTTP